MSGGERMSPAQAGKASEITVRGDQLTSMFDRERGEIRIGHKRTADVGAQREDIPMAAPVCIEGDRTVRASVLRKSHLVNLAKPWAQLRKAAQRDDVRLYAVVVRGHSARVSSA